MEGFGGLRIPPTLSDGLRPGSADGLTAGGVARAAGVEALPMRQPGPSRTPALVEWTSMLEMQPPVASPSPWLAQM